MDDTHFTIRIPKFSGYKTLFVNTAVLLLGVFGVLYPALGNSPVDPATVGLFYDSVTGGIVALIGAINIALRLITTTPVPGVAAKTGGSDSGEALRTSHELLAGALTSAPVVRMDNASQLSAYDYERMRGVQNARLYGSSLEDGAQPLTVGMALEIDRETSVPCNWPTCACHQPCEQRRATARPDIEAAADRIVQELCEPVVQLSVEERRRGAGKRRAWSARGAVAAFAMWFSLPSVMLGVAMVPVAILGGCGTVQEVNAVATASTLEQRAFALYGTFVVLEEQAAVLVRDRSIPKDVRKAIQRADKIAKPLADRLRGLAVQLNAARMAYNVTASSEGGARILALTQSIGATLAAFEPALRNLRGAIGSAKA